MRYFRNVAYPAELAVSAGLTVLFTAAAAFLSLPAAALVFCLGASLTVCHLLFTRRRYRDIRALSAALDRILHGEETVLIEDSDEGELAVLKTEIRKMTLRLQETNEGLLREKTRLADAMADVSHQLRTPLTAVNLLVSMLEDPELPDERRLRLCRDLENHLRRIEWLVDALLKLGKLDAGTVRFSPRNVPAGTLVSSAAQPLLIAFELKGVTLDADTDGATFFCDPAWTAEAVGNVLKNCLEHTPAGGTVRVTAMETPLFRELLITDSGPGINPEDLPHIFERYYRGKNAGENSVGIGLALSRMIASAQDGSLTAKNGRDGGAEFSLRFYKSVI